MIEKSPLPSDTESSCSELLECRDLPRHGMVRRRKPDQPVHMIRHDDEYTAPPNAAFLPMSDNIKQRGCAIAANQIIRPAGARADRDEEGRFLRNDAERSFMRKAFSLRIVHCSKMSCCGRLGPAVPTKTSFPPVGSGRRGDRTAAWNSGNLLPLAPAHERRAADEQSCRGPGAGFGHRGSAGRGEHQVQVVARGQQ